MWSSSNCNGDDDSDIDKSSDLYTEAQKLMARAKEIRDSLPPEEKKKEDVKRNISENDLIPEVDKISETETLGPSIAYRLSIDIGREDGTWMDRSWGASGRRIEFTMDVSFLLPDTENYGEIDPSLADEDIKSNMVKDNLSGKSSIVRILNCPSQRACLRDGLGYQMKCYGGGYRVDFDEKSRNINQSSTARFYVEVEGTPTSGGYYGDVFIPAGNLYFSLPCFNRSVQRLSTREGIVTVREYGWHTGWRRLESRIVGTFRAKPLSEIKK